MSEATTPEWEDPDTLKELYIDKRMSSHEIGDKYGVHNTTILRQLREVGIEPRGKREGIRIRKLKLPASYYMNSQGYIESATEFQGEKYTVYIHRLLAVAKYGFDAVADMEVHHKNGIKWDNRPSNIEVIDKSEHGRLHGLQRDFDVKVDQELCDEIASRYRSGWKQHELSDMYSLSQSTISLHANKTCHHD